MSCDSNTTSLSALDPTSRRLTRCVYIKPWRFTTTMLAREVGLLSHHYQFFPPMQYHTNRTVMDRVGKEDKTEKINRIALGIAREIAEETGTLFAGGVSSTSLFQFDGSQDKDPMEEVRAIFEEQVRWSKEEGVDYIIAETIWSLKEAKIALEVIKSFGLPAVVTLALFNPEKKDVTFSLVMMSLCLKPVDSSWTWGLLL